MSEEMTKWKKYRIQYSLQRKLRRDPSKDPTCKPGNFLNRADLSRIRAPTSDAGKKIPAEKESPFGKAVEIRIFRMEWREKKVGEEEIGLEGRPARRTREV